MNGIGAGRPPPGGPFPMMNPAQFVGLPPITAVPRLPLGTLAPPVPTFPPSELNHAAPAAPSTAPRSHAPALRPPHSSDPSSSLTPWEIPLPAPREGKYPLGPMESGQEFIRQLDAAYPRWRYDAPPGAQSFLLEGERFVSDQEAAATFILTQYLADTGDVIVVQNYGVEIVEYRTIDGLVRPVAIPPAAGFSKFSWNVSIDDYVPVQMQRRDDGVPAPGSGLGGFRILNTYLNAIPIIAIGKTMVSLTFTVINIAGGPWEVDPNGLTILGTLGGYVLNIPEFLPRQPRS